MIRSDFCRLLRCKEIPQQRSSASAILSRLQQIDPALLPGGNPFAFDAHVEPHTAAAQRELKCVSRFIDTFCASATNVKSCKIAQVARDGNRENHAFVIDGSRYVYSCETDGQEEKGNAPWLCRLDSAASVRRSTPPFVNCVASQSLRTHSRLPEPPRHSSFLRSYRRKRIFPSC
jgi:hypothetical protein